MVSASCQPWHRRGVRDALGGVRGRGQTLSDPHRLHTHSPPATSPHLDRLTHRSREHLDHIRPHRYPTRRRSHLYPLHQRCIYPAKVQYRCTHGTECTSVHQPLPPQKHAVCCDQTALPLSARLATVETERKARRPWRRPAGAQLCEGLSVKAAQGSLQERPQAGTSADRASPAATRGSSKGDPHTRARNPSHRAVFRAHRRALEDFTHRRAF